jgi:hypothetical protein
MRPDDLLEVLLQRPFRPFRLYLVDGTVYEIRHPDLVWVGRSVAQVGQTAVGEPASMDRADRVALLHICRPEPLASPSSPNGP